jgi:hypothetical protein
LRAAGGGGHGEAASAGGAGGMEHGAGGMGRRQVRAGGGTFMWSTFSARVRVRASGACAHAVSEDGLARVVAGHSP